MAETVDITLPVDPDVAGAFDDPERRQAAGRFLSGLMRRSGLRDALAEAIAETKREARSHGLADAEIDAEIAAWRRDRAG